MVGAALLAITPPRALAAPDETLEDLLNALDDDDYQVRGRACRSMRRNGPKWLAEGSGSSHEGDDPCEATALRFTIFGPEDFERTAGPPDTFARSFAVTSEGQLCVRVTNSGLSSASVSVDGIELFGPSDFKPSTAELSTAIDGDVGTHIIDIELASAPGASLTLEIGIVYDDDVAQLVEFFEQALADPSQNVVREAMLAAGDVPLVPIWEILRDVIQRKRGNFSSLTIDIGLRAFTKMSIALYPDQPAPVDALAVPLTTDRAATVRGAAAVSLAVFGSPLGIDVLVSALGTETNPVVRRAIVQSIAQLMVGGGS